MLAYVKISGGLYTLNGLWLVAGGKKRKAYYTGTVSELTPIYEFKIKPSHIPNIQSDLRLKV
jgi:hypothetical protein